MSRQGILDYLVTMRKDGVNANPVKKFAPGTVLPGDRQEFSVQEWQEYASPVWMDIDPGDTLTRTEAREDNDEKHICALQLTVIYRGIRLWTNPGDVVFSPYAGIGSEGHVALKMGRRFEGVELKRSYFLQAARNLKAAEDIQAPLFAEIA